MLKARRRSEKINDTGQCSARSRGIGGIGGAAAMSSDDDEYGKAVDLDSVDMEPFIRILCERSLDNDPEMDTIGYIGRSVSGKEA